MFLCERVGCRGTSGQPKSVVCQATYAPYPPVVQMIPKTESGIVLVAKIVTIVVEIAAYRQFNPGNTMGATIVF